jgi:hypothetical protein
VKKWVWLWVELKKKVKKKIVESEKSEKMGLAKSFNA